MKKFLGLFLVLGLLLTGCGSSDSSDTSDEKEYVDESEISNVYTNPEKYKGKYIKVSGQIFQTPEKDDDGIYFQMWGDIENYDLNTVVTFDDTSLELASDDYVIVDGKIEGEYEGENSFGGAVTALQITAVSVEKTTYQEIASPTIKEVILEGTANSQNSVDITVTKVEFAKNETRVYYTVSNNSGSVYSFYNSDMKIVQNGKQYEEQSNYDADYPSISGDIINGVTSEGIIAFPVIEQANFDLHFDDGYSDNYDLDFEEFSFTITVN